MTEAAQSQRAKGARSADTPERASIRRDCNRDRGSQACADSNGGGANVCVPVSRAAILDQMTRALVALLLILAQLPVAAETRRRAVQPPVPVVAPAAIVAAARQAAEAALMAGV